MILDTRYVYTPTLFTVRCDALTHLNIELEYDKSPQRTINYADYKRTLRLVSPSTRQPSLNMADSI